MVPEKVVTLVLRLQTEKAFTRSDSLNLQVGATCIIEKKKIDAEAPAPVFSTLKHGAGTGATGAGVGAGAE